MPRPTATTPMRVFYIAGKFRAPLAWDRSRSDMFQVQQHIMAAMAVARDVWIGGHVALCPHANTMFFTDTGGIEDRVWLAGDLILLRRCDAVITVPGWEGSRGARREVHQATRWQIPVFHAVVDALAWASGDR